MKVYGGVLAGGNSTRMGQDKACMLLDSKSLLEVVSDTLQRSGSCEVLVNRNPSQLCSVQDAVIVPDVYQDLGPLSGIHALLNHISEREKQQDKRIGLLILAVDQPLVSAQSVTELMAYGIENQTSASFFVAPAQHQAFFPLYIFDTHNALSSIEQIICAGDKRSVGYFWTKIGAQQIPLLDHSELLNVNNMQDYKTLCSKV